VRALDIHEPNEALQRQDLIHEVEEVCGLEPINLAQDRDNFSIPLSTRLAQATQQLHNYIQSQDNLILHSSSSSVRTLN
jgi:hypothetical protein